MWPAEPIPGQGLYIALAVALILLAAIAAVRGATYDRAKGKPRCRKCGYPAPKDKSATTTVSGGWSCPECGWSPRRAKDLLRVRRSRRWFVVSLLLLCCAWSSWYAIHVQFRRQKLHEPTATALTPTTWWIAVLPNRTGDEDLIVFHRAYSQGKLSGTARQVPLPGTGRSLTALRYAYRGQQQTRFSFRSGSSHLPGSQADWAARQLEKIFSDQSLPTADRIDALWLYACFAGIDDRHEVEVLIALLIERDTQLTPQVLDILKNATAAQDLITPALISIAEDDTYPHFVRVYACQDLPAFPGSAEPHILRWINDPNPQMRELGYLSITALYHQHGWGYSNGLKVAVRRRLLRAYFNSGHTGASAIPSEWLAMELSLVAHDKQTTHRRFEGFESCALVYLSDPSPASHRRLKNSAFQFAVMLHRMEGMLDHRTIDAWAWLLRDGYVLLRREASVHLEDIAFACLGNQPAQAEARAYLRPIIETALSIEADQQVRDNLNTAIGWLSGADNAVPD